MKYHITYTQWRSKCTPTHEPQNETFKTKEELLTFLNRLIEEDTQKGWSHRVIQLVLGKKLKVSTIMRYKIESESEESKEYKPPYRWGSNPYDY
jgi:hypothetical protein